MGIEIKFRAWNGEQMISPDYIDRKGVAWWKEDSIPCSSKNVMKYTGLKDKNGVDAYTDDIGVEILPNGEKRFFKIWIEKGGFVINQFQDDFKKPNEKIQFWSGLSDMQNASWFENCVEIIGNIHQNPELLTQ